MPVGGVNNHSQSYSISSASEKPGDKSRSPSELAQHLYRVNQSQYGFSRGHRRQNACDFRVETAISSASLSNVVSRQTTTLVDKAGSGARIKP